jgi:hypothetical protein
MVAVDYITLLQGAATLAGLDPNFISSGEQEVFQRALQKRLQTIWDHEAWPDVMRIEKRRYKPLYIGSEPYTFGEMVFYAPTGKYYQVLTASQMGLPPATADGATDFTRWAECKADPDASTPIRSATAAYKPGDHVYEPTEDASYQCTQAHSGQTPAGDVTPYWSRLLPFEFTVPYEQEGETKLGTILEVWDKHPLIYYTANRLEYVLTQDGVRVPRGPSVVWVDFRMRCPLWTGKLFDPARAYMQGEQVYFSSQALPGNFYNCMAGTSAGQDPESTPEAWSRSLVPQVFQRYLERGAYADWLISEGENDRAAAESGSAKELLADQALVLRAQQQQEQRTIVNTR